MQATHQTHKPLAGTGERHASKRHAGHGWWHFVRHYLEMVAAMVVGMVVLGGAVQAAVAAAGLTYSAATHPELAALEMAVDMSVGMVLWMRYRGHGWASTLEMTAAMFVPALALFPLLWLGALSGESLVMLTHVLMLPLMLLAMLRRRGEYAG